MKEHMIDTTNAHSHIPVLLDEAVEGLKVQPGSWYIDATLGQGGHTTKLLSLGARVIAFEWDDEAIAQATTRFADQLSAGNLVIVHENFAQLRERMTALQPQLVGSVRGILFDFGTSTNQLMSSERGFSFEGDGILDMRMDRRLGVMAKDLLAVVPENQLAQLFIKEGGEHAGKKIAKAIKNAPKPVETVSQLSELVSRVVGGRHGKLHPATKVFQALRIAVNSELTNVEEALPQAYYLLAPAGRLVTIAFHEGEDRLVKQSMVKWQERGLGMMLTKPVITSSESELQTNPRSRSAKLRIFEKST